MALRHDKTKSLYLYFAINRNLLYLFITERNEVEICTALRVLVIKYSLTQLSEWNQCQKTCIKL